MAETHTSKTYVNVQVSDRDRDRIVRADERWTGTRLVVFALVFLGLCLVVLYAMASLTSETTWGDWLWPWP